MLFNKIGFVLMLVVLNCAISEASLLTVGLGGKYDYESIQEAVWAASNGDEIVVAPGVYTATWRNVVVDTQGKSIWLHSSQGANLTIIDGTNNARGLRCRSKEDTNTIIEGFTVTNCRADGGGGALLEHSSPSIINCVFEYNTSEQDYYYSASGGAILCDASSPIITGCSFISNTSEYNGGAIYNKNFSSPTIAGCLFDSNTSLKGGAICNTSSSDTTITDTSFQYNSATFYGGAVYLIDYCSVSMTNCTVLYNSAQIAGGGVYNQGGELAIIQCLLNQNYTFDTGGAGIAINSGNATISMSEFKDNVAPIGAGIYIFGTESIVSVGNTSFCGNSVDHITGEWQNAGNNEFYSSCDQGACCTNDICVPIDPETCNYVAGEFQGLGINCEEVVCSTECFGDINGDSIVDIVDVLELIGAWGACP